MTSALTSVRPVVQSGAARAASFLPAAVATLLTSRLIIRHFGVPAFDAFALMVALIALIPLNDLGVGTAVTSAFAERGPRADYSARVLLTSARVLTVSMLGVFAAAAALAAAGLWPTLLGAASGPDRYVAVAVAVFGLSFVPGLGQRMLLGVHRNHVTVVVQTFFSPLMLALVAFVMLSGLPSAYLVIVPSAALLLVALATLLVAVRSTGFDWWQLVRRLPRPRRYPGQSIRALAGPMLLTTIAVPIALQSDRIVLSHVSTAGAVANYSVVVQIFAPVAALIAASAQPLWPIWVRANANGSRGPGLGKVLLAFLAGAGLLCAVLVAIADPVGDLVGGRRIELGWILPVAAALAVLVQAAAYPIAMRLMDPAGVRFVAGCTVLALPLNIGLSIWLGRALGAPGPLFATFLVGVVVQAVPALLYHRARSTVGRHRARAGQRRTVTATLVAATPAEISH